MAEPRHLTNAPLREAVIDFRVERTKGASVDDLKQAAEFFGDDYEYSGTIRLFEGQIVLSEEGADTGETRVAVHGFKYKSKDNMHVVQIKNDGLTFSRLQRYSTWAEVSGEAFRIWELYKRIAGPLTVTRTALRYVNQMDVPLKDGGSFLEYLTAPPRLPDSLPQSISNFLVRVVVHDENRGLSANVIQTLDQAEKEGHVRIILDVDVYKEWSSEEQEGIMVAFNDLHDFKNDVFFHSITERTAGLFT